MELLSQNETLSHTRTHTHTLCCVETKRTEKKQNMNSCCLAPQGSSHSAEPAVVVVVHVVVVLISSGVVLRYNAALVPGISDSVLLKILW